MTMRNRLPAALALTVGLAAPGSTAWAHNYDNGGAAEPDKTIDGPLRVSPDTYDGVPGYWVEYTRFTYRDVAVHFHAIDKAFEAIEAAYCKKPGEWGGNDSTSIHCHPGQTGQATVYSGSVSPHAQGMRIPLDQREFASYLRAATNGFNNGQGGGINQGNALAGTRYGQVANQKQFDAATARMYAFQFAAQAKGLAANTIDGMAQGARSFYSMAPAAQLFMQVAAVYKGNLAANASNYNNNALRALLKRKAPNLANGNNVGNKDVETLGAIAAALDQGLITLDDIIDSGAIGNQANYKKAIEMVENGTFAMYLADYDRSGINAGQGNGNLNANSGNAGFNAPGAGVNQSPASLGAYYKMFAYQNDPTRVEQLADSDAVARAMLELHDLNGIGRIYGAGEAENFVASMRCFMSMLMDGQRTLADLPEHDRNHMIALDTNRDGVISDAEFNAGLAMIEKFSIAVAEDAKTQSGGLAPGGEACNRLSPSDPDPDPTPTPKPPPPPVKPPTGYGG